MVESADATKTVINCEPTIDISAAQALYEHLAAAISNGHEVVINAGDVTRADAAILQVFTAFMLESKAQELSVTWEAVSEAFYNAAQLLGLVDVLDLPARD